MGTMKNNDAEGVQEKRQTLEPKAAPSQNQGSSKRIPAKREGQADGPILATTEKTSQLKNLDGAKTSGKTKVMSSASKTTKESHRLNPGVIVSRSQNTEPAIIEENGEQTGAASESDDDTATLVLELDWATKNGLQKNSPSVLVRPRT